MKFLKRQLDLIMVGGDIVYPIQTLRVHVSGLRDGPKNTGLEVSFTHYDKRQIDILLKDAQSPFSKIAYRNLDAKTLIVRSLQNEIAQAVILDESQRKNIARICKVTGQSIAQVRRVAQT